MRKAREKQKEQETHEALVCEATVSDDSFESEGHEEQVEVIKNHDAARVQKSTKRLSTNAQRRDFFITSTSLCF